MIDTLWHIAPVVIAIALGYFAGFVTAAVMAVSSEVSRWEDAQPVRDDSAEVAALRRIALFASVRLRLPVSARRRVDRQMATGQAVRRCVNF